MSGLHAFFNVAAFALTFVVLKRVMTKRSHPLPPGPRKQPLLGNLFDMPRSQEWFKFAEWCGKWGDIVSVSVFGQHMIILNSAQTAIEMLEKKSSIYSDRPVIPMAGELVGWNNLLVLLPYQCERFRIHRRLLHQTIGTPAAASNFHVLEEEETRKFLKRVLDKPNNLVAHIRKTAGAIILRIAYGYQVKEGDDPFVTLADDATSQFAQATSPGFLVNFVPALCYIPEWVPGAGFKKTAAAMARTLVEMTEKPYQFVKQQMALGTAEPSFTSKHLAKEDLTPEEEHNIKWSAASLYSGGTDTSVSAIHSLFLAMLLYPDVLRKAQQELDAVVGNDRLPSFADRNNLPYINALAIELLRWHSAAPLIAPHRVTEDDIHNGYRIPKGAMVFTNNWGIAHDPKVYSDPFAFKPERFLGPTPEQDPREYVFGFGRRICLGRLLVDSSIFISCAMSLAVFDITKFSKNGIVVEPVHEQLPGTISHPKPFQCVIKPRSQKAADLITFDDA